MPDPLVGKDALFVTNWAHNLFHLLTALGFTVVALLGNTASRRFMLAFGVAYTLIGVWGFSLVGVGMEGHLFGIIHTNFLDNFLDVGLGAAIAVGGIWAMRLATSPATTPSLS